MNRFIESISDLIIITSNTTLEVSSLRPWLLIVIVLIVVKGELANETVNYDPKTKG